MPDKTISMMAREIAQENGVELDFDGLDKLREITDAAGATWPEKALDILKEKNPQLVERLNSLESHINSLLLIPYKPPALRKEFKAKLEDYKKTIEICADYANRHITK